MPESDRVVIRPEALDALFAALRARSYRVLGPTVADGAIVYADLDGADELPVGWKDRQDGGTYRLERRDDEARFGFAVGPHSWKQFLFPPQIRLWRARRNGDNELDVEEEPLDETPLAFVGVRSCELHAIAIQDRVFIGGRVVDRDYAARREGAFIVAVNCFEPGGTCFCVSMGTGPRAEAGYDLALTEILEGEHRLLVEAGTRTWRRGARASCRPRRRPSPTSQPRTVRWKAPRERMGRRMEAGDLRDLLAENLEHPRWDDVAERCLTLRQLHDGLPDVLLLERRGRDRPHRRRGRAAADVGLVLLARPFVHPRRERPTERALALPTVDDPQARDLARPVRDVGVRRLRALHHVVPRRDRHHRRGRGDHGERSGKRA